MHILIHVCLTHLKVVGRNLHLRLRKHLGWLCNMHILVKVCLTHQLVVGGPLGLSKNINWFGLHCHIALTHVFWLSPFYWRNESHTIVDFETTLDFCTDHLSFDINNEFFSLKPLVNHWWHINFNRSAWYNHIVWSARNKK
jgi:hypothetical protein